MRRERRSARNVPAKRLLICKRTCSRRTRKSSSNMLASSRHAHNYAGLRHFSTRIRENHDPVAGSITVKFFAISLGGFGLARISLLLCALACQFASSSQRFAFRERNPRRSSGPNSGDWRERLLPGREKAGRMVAPFALPASRFLPPRVFSMLSTTRLEIASRFRPRLPQSVPSPDQMAGTFTRISLRWDWPSRGAKSSTDSSGPGSLVVCLPSATVEWSLSVPANSSREATCRKPCRQVPGWWKRAFPVAGLDDTRNARRTIVANDGKGQWALIATSSITLADASRLLCAKGIIGPLKIANALNLDGGSSTALQAGLPPEILIDIAALGPVRNYLTIAPRRP